MPDGVRHRLAWCAFVALLTLPAVRAHAQEPVTVLVGVEARRDRIRYHFDNPSSAGTPFLVPHFFEQTFEADNVWLVATARYTGGGVRFETSAGLAPSRSVRADDYDTFFDPGDVVIVSGTTGNASSQSLLVSQRADVGRAGPVQVSLGYRLRWDRFDFGVGHKTVTRNGVLTSATDVTSPELTDSKVHELIVGFRAAPHLGPASPTRGREGGWHLALSGDVSPMTLARLSVQLPDKYPGSDLAFFAKVGVATARVALARAGERWPIEVALQVERSWSYRSTAQLSRSAQSISLHSGHSW